MATNSERADPESRGVNPTLDSTLILGLALIGFTGPLVFAVLVTVGGFVEDDYSHVSQKISELGGVTAEYPWIQNLAFYLMSLSAIALALGIHRGLGHGQGSMIGPVMIGVFGFSSAGLNAVFPCDAECSGITAAGKLHLITGAGGFLITLVGMAVLSRRMRRTGGWEAYSRYTLATAVLGFATLIGFIASSSNDDSTIDGLAQRIFAGLVLAWFAATGWWLYRRTPRG